jgi:hypothetical protein
MPGAVSVTPADIRAYANLPNEVPEALLASHIEIATRDLGRATGVMDAPDGLHEEWAEALTVRALASAYPWLNTFALNGAAKVGRLEGSVEFRFLDAEEVEKKIENLNGRFAELVAMLTPQSPDETPPDEVGLGAISMMSI